MANGGNGCAGPIVAALAGRIPCEIIPVFEEPDGLVGIDYKTDRISDRRSSFPASAP